MKLYNISLKVKTNGFCQYVPIIVIWQIVLLYCLFYGLFRNAIGYNGILICNKVANQFARPCLYFFILRIGVLYIFQFTKNKMRNINIFYRRDVLCQ